MSKFVPCSNPRDQYEIPRFIIKTDLGPEKGEKLLTFRLEKYPDYPLQLSPKKHILAIHGIKPNKFILDLKSSQRG